MNYKVNIFRDGCLRTGLPPTGWELLIQILPSYEEMNAHCLSLLMYSILFGLTRTTIICKWVNLHMQLNDRAISQHLCKDITLWKQTVSSSTNVYTITSEWSSYALLHSIIKSVYFTFHGNIIPPVASWLKTGKRKGGKNSPVLTKVQISGKDNGLCLSSCLNPKVIHALVRQ